MTFRGYLERVGRGFIEGWAFDDGEPSYRISLVVSVDGLVIGRVLADQLRLDLASAGVGDGHHAFHFAIAAGSMPLGRCVVAVRHEGDGTHLSGSPAVVEALDAFDQDARTIIAAVLSASGDATERESRIRFVAGLLDSLDRDYAKRIGFARTLLSQLRREHAALARGSGEDAAEEAVPRSRALVIDEVMPVPGRDAGSNAVLSHMRSLQRLGFAVSFVPASLVGDPAALAAAGIECFLQPTYTCVEDVLRQHANAYALVYLHRGECAASYLRLARRQQPHARVVYSVADLHSLRLARQAGVEERPDLRRHAEGMRALELTAAMQADAVITHSRTEALLLRQHLPPGRVHVVPWDVPTRPTEVAFAERRGCAFIGHYGHAPNVDAARWLVEAVVPELSQRGPALPCLLVGSGLPEQLRRLATSAGGNGIEAVGEVADLTEVFDRVRLTVAPLAYGAGVKGKVLDSLAAGVPCVCSPVAAEGLDLPPLLLGLVATTPAEMAETIRRLHEDEALHAACRDAGLAFIADTVSEERIDELMLAALGHSGRPKAGEVGPTIGRSE